MARLDRPIQYRKVREGLEPAEILTPYDRRVLITNLVREGMTDQQISDLTLWTPYVVARLRDELYLQPNQPARNEWIAA
jgi:hypothetical protein